MPALNAQSAETRSLALRGCEALRRGEAGAACDLLEAALARSETTSAVERGELLSNYSAALFATHKYTDAVGVAEEATKLCPESADAWVNFGIACQASERIGDGVEAYITALELDGAHENARLNLAFACEHLGRVDSALEQLRLLLESHPDSISANYELGRILLGQRQPDRAGTYLEHAAALAPDDPDIANTAGVALRRQSRAADAVAYFQKAVALQPNHVGAQINLSRVLKESGDLDGAIAAARCAIKTDSENPAALNNLASAVRSQGQAREAVALFEHVESIASDRRAGSNALCAKQYLPETTKSDLKAAHVAWAERHDLNDRLSMSVTSHSDKPVRVGMISPDFGQHPVGYFLSGLLSELDPLRVDVTCYSDRRVRDPLTQRLEKLVTSWRETASVANPSLSRQIARDEVDVLIDLAGHTSGNRLDLFAGRAAPIQATWLGYVGTTGVTNIDYLLADRFHVRPGEEDAYVESVLRLPDGYLTYEAPDAPDVSELPATLNRFVTFGAFHNPAKISQMTVELWARVLNAVAESRILFKYIGYDSAGTQAHVRQMFARCGIPDTRLDFAGPTNNYDHLAALCNCDLMLDPTPYSGGLTTCESLWMGIPVVTLSGETFAGRHATSHLTNAGYEAFVADSPETYVAIATEWAKNLAALAAVRREMRDRVAASPLCDARRFARSFEQAMSGIVSRACMGTPR